MKITGAVMAIVDTETTGLDHATDHLVEYAIRTYQHPWGLVPGGSTQLVNPGRPIPVMSSAIHHIIDRDVVDAISIDEAQRAVAEFTADIEVIIAQQADFDRGFLPSIAGKKWCCAKRLAQHLFPEAPAHNNQVLRYWFNGADLDLEGGLPHRAMADVIVTGFNLQRILECYLNSGLPDDVDEMIAFAESPIMFPALPFGKHRGEPVAKIPEGYLRWMLQQADLDRDFLFTARQELRRRGRAA